MGGPVNLLIPSRLRLVISWHSVEKHLFVQLLTRAPPQVPKTTHTTSPNYSHDEPKLLTRGHPTTQHEAPQLAQLLARGPPLHHQLLTRGPPLHHQLLTRGLLCPQLFLPRCRSISRNCCFQCSCHSVFFALVAPFDPSAWARVFGHLLSERA